MASAQWAAWQYVQQYGEITTYALYSDPNNDLSFGAVRNAIKHLRDRGAIERIGKRDRGSGYNRLCVYAVADASKAPTPPNIREV